MSCNADGRVVRMNDNDRGIVFLLARFGTAGSVGFPRCSVATGDTYSSGAKLKNKRRSSADVNISANGIHGDAMNRRNTFRTGKSSLLDTGEWRENRSQQKNRAVRIAVRKLTRADLSQRSSERVFFYAVLQPARRSSNSLAPSLPQSVSQFDVAAPAH